MRSPRALLAAIAVAALGAASATATLSGRLGRGKRAAETLASLIHHRFELNSSLGSDFVHTSHNIGKDAWEALKYKFALKIAESYAGASDRRNSSFVYVFGGSSVTAGHDNYYHESYPKVFERRMKPLFDALHVDLSVRNIAVGSIGCEPYNACYEAFGGSDPDFVTWEQSYFCKASESTESLARYAASSRNHAVISFLASGSPVMTSCTTVSQEKIAYCDEKWTPAAAGLPEWRPTHAEIQAEMLQMDSFHQAGPTGAAFYRYLDPYKASIKQYGMEFWVQNSKASLPSMNHGDAILSSCKLKFATADALRHGSGHGTSSHPTVAKHLMRAELLAWVHGMILLDAIYMVHKDFEEHNSENKLVENYSAKIGAIFPEALPKELICGKSLHCPHRLECYSDFEPHFNEKKFLSDLIIGKMEWERHDNGESRGERWKTYGYNDTKWRYESQSQTSPLNLKLVVGSLGVVQICVQDGSAVPDFYVDISVTNVNANYVFKNSTKRWENVKRSDTACGRGRNSLHLGFELYGLPKGTHVLSIYNKNVAISHVLMWPDS